MRNETMNKTKNEIMSKLHSLCFTSFLRLIMKQSGYDLTSTATYNISFHRLRNLALLDSAHSLIHQKLNQSHDITEEQNLFEQILLRFDFYFEADFKMIDALEKFRINLPNCLKECMLGTDFLFSGTASCEESYAELLKSIIQFEQTKYDQQRKTIKMSEENTIHMNVFINNISIEKCLLARSSTLHLLAKTEKYMIYLIVPEYMVLKVLRATNDFYEGSEKLDHELKVTKICSHPSIRSAFSRTTYHGKQGILLEMVEGYTIDNIVLKQAEINKFLRIAKELVYALLVMHSNKIVHKNLNCDHVMFNPESSTLKIIGTGSSIGIIGQKKEPYIQTLLDRNLYYFSPERTGLINRDIDFRSDLYSLGVIFYKLLTGVYPIEGSNALEIINNHITCSPMAAHDTNPCVPVPLSDMISKLLQKDPEDRYKSTKGVVYDLELIISGFSNNKKMASITLGQHDTAESFRVSQKLRGRSNEYKTLCSVFDNFSSDNLDIVFITGNSGVGKSELVMEFYKTYAHRGKFCSGKYDHSNLEPYSALMEALRNFCNDLLFRDKVTIANYKYRIIEAVGDEGILLTSAINNLHLIIGQQPSIAECLGRNAKNRFSYVLVKFIKAICSVGFPLILILEDLQWIDSSSCDIMTALIKDSAHLKNLILIGTYRENEVGNNHKLKSVLKLCEQKGTKLTMINLKNLDEWVINDILLDSLSCSSSFELFPLTALLLKKTNGNPFYMNQVLQSYYEEGLIYFCSDTCRWKWNDEIFDEMNIAENIFEIIRNKMLTLDDPTLMTLKVASCLGNPFSLSLVKVIVNSSTGIDGALSTGMITQYKGSNTLYRFTHDNIKEAALSLVPQNDNISFYMGIKLLTLLPAEELDRHIFTVANLLLGASCISHTDNLELVQLFTRAGEESLSITAFDNAFQYFKEGLQLLGANSWDNNYDLTLRLHINAAKSAFGMQNDTMMNEMINVILVNASSSSHWTEIYSLKIMRLKERRLFKEAVDAVIFILNKLGERIDESMYNNSATIAASIERVKRLLHNKSDEEILEMKQMEYAIDAIISIFCHVFVSELTDLNLYKYASIRMVELSLIHGLSNHSCVGFASFGVILSIRGDEFGHRLGKLALALLKKHGTKEVKPTVYMFVYGVIHHHFSPIHETLKPLSEAIKISLDVGIRLGAVKPTYLYSSHSFYIGKNLSQILNDMNDLKKLLPLVPPNFLELYQAVQNLISKDTVNPFKIDYEDNHVKVYNRTEISVSTRMMEYLFHEYSAALKSFRQTEKMAQKNNNFNNLFTSRQYYFYYGLVSLALAQQCKDKSEHIEKAGEIILKFRHFSTNAPQNYLNKVFLLEAEYNALHGKKEQAEECYAKAISVSRQNEFLHEEGIANERAGMYYSKSNQEKAVALLLQSYKCYKAWGAESKCQHLITLHPFLEKEVKKNNALQDFHELIINNDGASHSSLSTIASNAKKRVRFEVKDERS